MVFREKSSEPWYQVGIVSYGTQICGIGEPGVYTKVEAYLSWIESKIKTWKYKLVHQIKQPILNLRILLFFPIKFAVCLDLLKTDFHLRTKKDKLFENQQTHFREEISSFRIWCFIWYISISPVHLDLENDHCTIIFKNLQVVVWLCP